MPRLSPEDGSRLPDTPEAKASAIGQLGFDFTEPDVLPGEEESSRVGPRTQALMLAAMEGSIPTHRPLKMWEPEKLSPMHINMILDRAAGMRPGEIAEKYAVDFARTSVILNHPMATKLYATIMGEAADALADPRKRIEGYAHEMIEVKIDLVRNTETHPRLRNAIADDLLDRAGYGARHVVDINNKHTIQMPAVLAERLASGLDEAARLREIPYADFVQAGTAALATPSAMVPTPLDGEVTPASGDLPSGPGQPEVVAGTSPDAHPVAAPEPPTAAARPATERVA